MSHMAPALTPKALERAGVPPVGCAFLSSFSPLAVLSLVSICCSPCANAGRCAVGPRLSVPDWSAHYGSWVTRSTSVHPSPPMASLSGAI